jgi:tetratricopeptide (TPR) repeat protein
VAEPDGIRYRAFIAHARADVARAKRLHLELESTTVDADLAGRKTASGPVPAAPKRVFRSHQDRAGWQSLDEETVDALERSAALIVLCSTVAAGRPAINEEVRHFRLHHPDRPVVQVVIDGAPPLCYPPTLRFALEADGRLSAEPIEVEGIELHESADGRMLGLAGIVARLTGLPLEEVVRRAERDRRRHLGQWVAGLALAAVVLAGLFAWSEIARREAIGERAALRTELKQSERYFAVTREGADRLVSTIAQGVRATGGAPAATLANVERTIADLGRSAGNNPELLHSQSRMLMELADAHGRLGGLADQRRLAEDALGIAERLVRNGVRDDERLLLLQDAMVAHASVLAEAGETDAALVRLEKAAAVSDGLVARHPKDARFLEPGGGPRVRIGRMLAGAGRTVAALEHLEAERERIEYLVSSEGGNVHLLHALGSARALIAGLQLEQGARDAALESLREAAAVFERLIALDPRHAAWSLELAAAYERTAALLAGDGRSERALVLFSYVLKIRERLIEAAPEDGERQQELAATLGGQCALLERMGRLAEAHEACGRRAALVEAAEVRERGRPGRSTAIELGERVAWLALLTRKLDEALLASTRAVVLAPGRHRLKATRTLALVLLGRREEALAVHRANRQRTLGDGETLTWEEKIRSDVAALRAAGIEHADLATLLDEPVPDATASMTPLESDAPEADAAPPQPAPQVLSAATAPEAAAEPPAPAAEAAPPPAAAPQAATPVKSRKQKRRTATRQPAAASQGRAERSR